MREGYFIKKLKCVNKVIESRTKKEWRHDNKELIKKRKQSIYNFKKSWGGDYRNSNNLLRISMDLFI